MTSDQYIKAITKFRIKVSPVLGKRNKIDFWQAARMTRNPSTGQNYTKTSEFSEGSSPEQAVEKLLMDETVFKHVRGGFVENKRNRK